MLVNEAPDILTNCTLHKLTDTIQMRVPYENLSSFIPGVNNKSVMN